MAMDNITLTSGMRQNLFSLQSTAKSMDVTQNRLSSGKKVNSALDDPIAFFAAQGHTQRSSDLAIRKDEMSEAIQTIKAADNGIGAVLDLIASAKSLAQSALANQDTTERGKLTAQYNDLISQIATVAADSNYKGTNLLGGTTQELTITFDESGDSTLTVAGVAGDGGASDASGAWGDSGHIGRRYNKHQLEHHPAGHGSGYPARQLHRTVQQAVHGHHPSGFYRQDDQHPGRWRGQPDQCRPERRRRQPADAADTPAVGYHITEHGLPSCPGGSEIVLSNTGR
jgi:hypothetical protein